MNHKQTHRGLTEAYAAMLTEETSGATKGQMLSCVSELEDMLEGHEKTKDLAKKAESLGRAIRKAFKEPKAEDDSKSDDSKADEE